jgi:hypothetical protein
MTRRTLLASCLVGGKSIGKKDPGAVADMLLIKAFYEYLERKI